MLNLPPAINELVEKAKGLNRQEVAYLAGGALAVGVTAACIAKKLDEAPKSGPYSVGTLPKDAYDAVIVGAGPSGSVCGYYMAR